MNKLIFLSLVLLLQSCATVNYKSDEYVINKNRIPNFNVRGKVIIKNNQLNREKAIFFERPILVEWSGNYNDVTEHMVMQLKKEIDKHKIPTKSNDIKTIGLKVVRLKAVREWFYNSSSMDVIVKLGDQKEIKIIVDQGSPGNIWRVLNGTIALGVIDILKNRIVLEYLAK